MKLIRLAALVCAAHLIGASAVAAQEPLQVHGYLTQGYAQADSLSVLGITDEATADYRTAALQFRYALSTSNALVLQVSHRRMGASSLVPDGSIDLDWAFYQHRFGPASVKVGRFPSAVGIYNEVRDVGTLIPFYRPPASVYMEGFETVDGAMVSAGHALGKWFFDGTVYGGGADFAGQTVTPTETFGYTQRLEGTIGVQAWIATPIPGVRAGASSTWFDFDVEGLGERAGSMTVLSADVSRDRMQVRGEYSFLEVEDVTKMNSWYAQAGVRTWRDLWLNAQYEATDTESPTATGMVSEETLRDAALGVSYKFSPRVVFKFEGHDRKGYDFDSYVDRAGESAEGRYWITSVSVAF